MSGTSASEARAIGPDAWPDLPYEEWRDTLHTLHRWTQIVGKVRMELSPWINHSWSVPLYVSARGLTTSLIPFAPAPFQIDFDFIDHRLLVFGSDGAVRSMGLGPITVAQFYSDLLESLEQMGVPVSICAVPNEVVDPVPFFSDTAHASYDPEYASRFWRALLQVERVFQAHRARFIGKASPVHFFWGSFDLAVTRFSGRSAPPHPGGIPNLPDEITREAYSHEVSSCGFWPGNEEAPVPIFYSYAYPAPDGFSTAPVSPEAAYWEAQLGEFVLPYDAVRTAASPDGALTEFLEGTYVAAAELGGWDREALERPPGFRPLVRERGSGR